MNKKDQEKRIFSDIEQFYGNVNEAKEKGVPLDILELAKKYCEDSKYFLKKGDLITAFGCINYAHGLIDGYRKK
ncbi:MAG: DUF357 domain-containing protein, partial [Candidatus Micrarchaeota archaeon]